MKGLDGKVAMVTGGGSGIGRATAIALAECGVAVAILDRNATTGAQTQRMLIDRGASALSVTADVADDEQVRDAVVRIATEFSELDILVNCAATFIVRGIDATVEEWRRVLEVNVVGYALCVKHAVPYLRRRGGGAIVNVSSVSAFVAQPNFVTYSTTKGAIIAMTRCLALDLASDSIRVNAVAPGSVWTEGNAASIQARLGLARAEADAHPDIGGRHLLRRLADPEEVAQAVVFLASTSASFITGETLMVDGGYTAW